MAAMTMDHLSGGRFILGLGVSGPQVAEGWYGEPFGKPLARTREYVSIVRDVIARREPVASDGPHYPLPVERAGGDHRPGQAAEVDPAPAARAHPDLPRRRGAQERRLDRRDRGRVARAVLLPLPRRRPLRPVPGGGLRAGASGRTTTSRSHASVPFIVHDDVEQAADTLRPMLALYFGGMGARSMNFHHQVLVRMGYEAEAQKIQELYLDGKKDEAAAAVPTKLIEELALIGPADKIRHDLEAWRESRVTSLLIAGRRRCCGRRRSSCSASSRGRMQAHDRDQHTTSSADPARRCSGDRHGRGQGRDVRALPCGPRRRRHPGRAAGRRRVARRRRRCTTGSACTSRRTTRASAASWSTTPPPEGRDRLLRLLDCADIWIETTSPGALSELGLGADVVRARNPALVVLSITDFGQTGPYRDWVATDWTLLAMGGVLSRSGLPGREPLMPPGDLALQVTAMQADVGGTGGVLEPAGVRRRATTSTSRCTRRRPRSIDPAMGTVGTAQAAGYEHTRGRPAPGPYPIFRCRDGHVRVVLLAPRQWHAMRAWLGEPDDLQDPELETIRGRALASDRLHAAFEQLFRERDKHELTLEGQARGVPIAPVLTPADVLAAEHFRARGAIARTELARGIAADAPTGFARDRRRACAVRSPRPGARRARRRGVRRAGAPARGSRGRGRPRAPAAGGPARAGLRRHRARRRGSPACSATWAPRSSRSRAGRFPMARASRPCTSRSAIVAARASA